MYEAISSESAALIIAEWMGELKEQLDEDSSIEENIYLFELVMCEPIYR